MLIPWGVTENRLARVIRRFKPDADAPDVQMAVAEIKTIFGKFDEELYEAIEEAQYFENLWLRTRWTWRGLLARTTVWWK